MSSTLSKRRKHELKELAASLGLSAEGVREDLVERIRQHVLKHGTSDSSLRDLLREDSATSRRSTESSRLASLSSANDDDDDSSDGGVRTRSRRSSPKKSAMHVTETRKSKSGRGSDSDSAEDPLSEHRVRNFMGDLQDDIHDAKELASSLEHTLHDKLQSGKETIRRASKDITSSVVHALDGVAGIVSGNKDKTARRGSHQSHTDEDSDHHHSHHSHHCRHGRHGEEEQGLCGQFCSLFRHSFANCAPCTSKKWEMLHDLGSNSLGFVWVTLVLELAVFLYSAFAQNSQHGNGWLSCLHFLTNWPNFLKPFFAYYGALFAIPTLLSQLYNVDRARSHKHEQQHPSGLLSRKTTSGLSYFVFKFAMAYFLSQTLSANLRAANSPSLVGLAKEAVETVVSHSGFGAGHQPVLLRNCCMLPQVFRYIPESVSLATSGVGTVLALAETALSRRR
ncbi:hypothetical protein BGZ95_005611 [Linnemannia exigua]|uniref:SAP domain-containing protein n=1 Tax=Linnemannia exigua TaxID=604196 RepID=A0AAD4DLH6_9FUNG|nr:hypothetical protein BGZ95_005611 [Linnemannia exigua]